ncbi:hypothetical protein B7P43_G07589 [Cryptotermes secundus]|uniref:Uncharacterized protein n=1 Tax=Cryptotermes secundus TaxID=105785 RepID=A0A2J7QHT3_9NEOP|nr:uncharacterized protein LOC111867419 [Cryptotermes secundus]XP_033608574.1 uncharacterized protein LOC111867419 [Cryptotermes secundus]PNF28148.1 hypothetical protein B7P43_G07589 [Cryptotermes secundus]
MPPRLYTLCLEVLIPLVERIGDGQDFGHGTGPLDSVAGALTDDLLLRAYHRASRCRSAGCWKDAWKTLLTPKSQSVVLSWDRSLLQFVKTRCQNTKKVLVSRWDSFEPESLSWLPSTVTCLDFDGELFYRGRLGPALDFPSDAGQRGWLPEAEAMLKALHAARQKQPGAASTGLTELHLGAVQVTATDICTILRRVPTLQMLRHYQLVTALNLLHGEQWRHKEPLPKYRLRNLDVDFSHVVRCRMSPQAVLPPDVLQLAVLLCPEACLLHVRFDCSTSHDVLSPLTCMQHALRLLSVVCVTSGERSRLTFDDVAPILEQHGADALRSLELKVIEEVDVHVILSTCPKLERLVLSGCGNVMPPTCPGYDCAVLRLRRLRFLFFADGDDFSWDHDVPPCFWRATLAAGHGGRLEGLFLESPRIAPGTALKHLPGLEVLSLCRCPEVTLGDVVTVCGLDKASARPPRYIRLSACEGIGPREQRRLRAMLKGAHLAVN